MTIDPKNRRHAADALRVEADRLKTQARTAGPLEGPVLWLRIRDLYKLAQCIEDPENPEEAPQ